MAERPTPAGWYANPDVAGQQRYWDGTVWTDQTRDSSSTEARQASLAGEIRKWVSSYGYRVESQSEFQAIIVRGKKPNHVLHLLLSIITAGLWLIVWIIVAIGGGERRRVISVDDVGTVQVTKESRSA